MPEKQYTSNINLTDAKRKPITVGTTFPKSCMHEGTFDSLMAQGHIFEVGIETTGTKAVSSAVTRSRSLVNGQVGSTQNKGPANHTPAAALNPPKRNTETSDEVSKKELKKQLKELGVDVPMLVTVDTLKKMLDKATDPNQNGATSDKVWTYNPADLKGIGLARLTATYVERCKEFNIESEDLGTEELLIEKLTSQYGK